MEHLFQPLQRFMASQGCIFDFKSMDYPSVFQQHLITAHFQLTALLKNTAHSEIVRLLHSSIDRQMQVFLPGLLYRLLLDFSAAQDIFQTYMPILRNQSWVGLDRLLQQLIRECFSVLKIQHKNAVISVAGKLSYFGQLSCDLLHLLIKAADCFDISEASLAFSNGLLELCHSILSQGNESEALKHLLADRLFYKSLRIITLLNGLDEEVIRDYRSRCVSMANRLFSFNRQRCLAMGWGANGVMRELEGDESLIKMLEEWREETIRSSIPPENPQIASLRLGMVLSLRVEAALRFVLTQYISQVEINVQMNWVFSRKEDRFQLLLVDILRYLLALPSQEMPQQQGLYLLEWLFYRSCSNQLFEVWKGELFHPCFCDPCPFPAAPERALRFLGYLLQTNFQFGETLLLHLLRQMSVPAFSKKLQQLLVEADSLNILNLNVLFTSSRLSPRTKAELRTAIGDSTHLQLQKFKEGQTQPLYVTMQMPVSQDLNNQDEIEVQFSGQSESSEQLIYDEAVESKPSQDKATLKVKVEKMFAEDLGQNLSILMLEPSLSNYKDFFRKLMEEVKTFKLNGENQTIELFVSQTAKITYLLFQNQFQDHSVPVPRDSNVVAHLLSTVLSQWRTNSLLGTTTKKIIRKVIEHFPTAEPGIWRHFLLHFPRGTVPQVREVKDWLIPKEKADYAVQLLRQLAPLSKELIDNAGLLKLALC